MAQQQYARQIGIAPPSANIGGYGTPAPPQAQQAGFPGMRPPSAPFNYAPNYGAFAPAFSSGYGTGNAMGAAGVSAIGAVASVASMAAFNPMGSFAGGFMGGVGRGIGAGLMGGLGAAAAPLALGYAAQQGIGAFVHGAQQQQQIQGQLGQFQFLNPQSRTGTGFSRDDATTIGNQIRSLSHLPELMTSVDELTKLMPMLKKTGAMSGVRDATEFAARFKESVKTIRDVSRMLGTTMEEAGEFFAHSKSVGFMSGQAIKRNAMDVQFTSGMTGLGTGQVMEMQQTGAGMAMQFGTRRSIGAAAITNLAKRIKYSQESGSMREGLLEDATGMTGDEAIRSGAEKALSVGMGFSQTAAGRLLMAGMMKRDRNGTAVIDQDLVKRVNSGEIGRDDLLQRASRLSSNDKISFQYRAKDLEGELAGTLNMGAFAQNLVGSKGKDAAALYLSQLSGQNLSSTDTDMMMAIGSGPSAGEEKSLAKRQAMEQGIRDKMDPQRILKKAMTKIRAETLGWAEQKGAAIAEKISSQVEDYFDDLVGRHILTMTKEGADRLVDELGSSGGQARMKEYMKSMHMEGSMPRGVSMAGSSMGDVSSLQRLGSNLGITSLTGEQRFADNLKSLGAAGWFNGVGPEGQDLMAEKQKFYTQISAAPKLGYSREASRGIINQIGLGKWGEMTADKRLNAAKDTALSQIQAGLGSASLGRSGFAAGEAFQAKGLSGVKEFYGTSWEDVERDLRQNNPEVLHMLQTSEKVGGMEGAGSDNLTNAVLGVMDKRQINVNSLTDRAAGASSMDVRTRAENMKAATKKLKESLGYGTLGWEGAGEGSAAYSHLSSDDKASKTIMKALDRDPKILKALRTDNIQETVSLLAKEGIHVSTAEAEKIMATWDQVDSKGNDGKSAIRESLTAFSNERMYSDMAVAQSAFGRGAEGISEGGPETVQALKRSMQAISTGGLTDENMGAWRSSISGIRGALKNMKGPERDDLLNSLGDLRTGIEGGLKLTGKALSGMSSTDVMKRYGIKEKELNSILGGGDLKHLSEKQIADIQDIAISNSAAGSLFGGGTAEAGNDVQSEISDTLKSLNRNLEISNTLNQHLKDSDETRQSTVRALEAKFSTEDVGKSKRRPG